MSRMIGWFALVWTLGVTIYLIFAPLYGERMTWTETTPSGAQVQITEPGSQTLLDTNGPRVLAVLAIPLLLVAIPFATKPRLRRQVGLTCGILLLGFAFLGSWSIGMFYYPSALGLLISAASMRKAARG